MKLNGNYTGSQKNDLFSNDVGECKTIMKIIKTVTRGVL